MTSGIEALARISSVGPFKASLSTEKFCQPMHYKLTRPHFIRHMIRVATPADRRGETYFILCKLGQ